MLTLLTATLCRLCSPRWYHPLMSYTYTLCSPKYSWGICYSAGNSRLILHSGSRLNCISPHCCAISAFEFLLPPLEVGWCEVARRELCLSVLEVPSSSSPLPSNAFIDAAWSAGASSFTPGESELRLRCAFASSCVAISCWKKICAVLL